MLVASNGHVMWNPTLQLQTYCEVELHYFPFDRQVCTIMVANWIFSASYANFSSKANKVDTSVMINSTEWTVLDTDVTELYTKRGRFYVSQVEFVLTLKRQSSYYVVTMILPVILLSFLGLMTFPLPPDSGEKISLSVTCLMAFFITQLMISEHMPTGWHSIPLISKSDQCYYPPEVGSMKYCHLGVLRKEYFRLVTKKCK